MQLAALASGLQARGWQPRVVVPEAGPLVDQLRSAGVDVALHPLAVLRRRLLSPGGVLRLGVQGLRERSALARLADGCSLVHSNTSVIVGGSGLPVPHVVHVREIYAGSASGLAARGWPLWRRRLMHADARVCVSEAVADQFGGHGPGTFVVHDGLTRDVGGRVVGRVETRPFRVAVLGRIADWKGQDVLIRSLADPALVEIGAVAVIAGDAYPGEPAPDVRALAGELGVSERVEFTGFTPKPEDILASVDAVAVPSTRPDPLPNSAIEALAAGRPVVAANHGGLPEIVRDRTTGILVRPGDPAALARALRELADDPERRSRMGAAAAADVRERFGLERMLDEIEGVYATLGVKR